MANSCSPVNRIYSMDFGFRRISGILRSGTRIPHTARGMGERPESGRRFLLPLAPTPISSIIQISPGCLEALRVSCLCLANDSKFPAHNSDPFWNVIAIFGKGRVGGDNRETLQLSPAVLEGNNLILREKKESINSWPKVTNCWGKLAIGALRFRLNQFDINQANNGQRNLET